MRTLAFAASTSVALISLASPSRLREEDLSKVDFAAECTTESNPRNRLLFEHERLVNSFLNINNKFGLSRHAVMHMSNERLANHGGTTTWPGAWNDGENCYSASGEFGLIGEIEQPEAKVYFFGFSALLGQSNHDSSGPKAPPYLYAHMSFFDAVPKPGLPLNMTALVSVSLSSRALQPSPDSALAAPESSQQVRAADPFEAYAISLLKKGEALVRWERADFMRAVGAIRAAASCLKCHEDAKEGDVLGAFTYEFGKSKAVDPDTKPETRRPPLMNTKPQKLIVKLSQEGRSMKAVARMLPGNEDIDSGGMHSYWAIVEVENELLSAGVVTDEMVLEQTKRRNDFGEGLPESMGKIRPKPR
jgi:hypothetical protein